MNGQVSSDLRRLSVAKRVPIAVVACGLLAIVPFSALTRGQTGIDEQPQPAPAATQAPSVLTWHNDNSRTGQNLTETILTPANVNTTQFGKKFTLSVDGWVFAQPLYVSNVSVPGKGTHNIVYVATENDSLYAFDAAGAPAAPLWHRELTNPAARITAVPCADTPNCPVGPVVGITGTPVIDASSGTLYVVAFTKENGSYFQRLHALNIATGAEKFGGPVVVEASVHGTGAGNVSGTIAFDPLIQHQRSALLLLNGVVYITWASFGDLDNYHGWVLGYSAATLARASLLNVTRNGSEGGIWQSGGGPSAGPDGSIFLQTGNGTFDANTTGGADFGDSFLRLSLSGGLSVADYFTPADESTLQSMDIDLGSGAGLIPPKQSGSFPDEIIGAGKQGIIYVVNRDNMGKFNAARNNVIQAVTGSAGGYRGSPAYFNNAVYYSGVADFLARYSLTTGLLSSTPLSESPTKFNLGSTPSISANGSANGIVWAIDRGLGSNAAVLHAYEANNVSQELYNSSQNVSRDNLGQGTTFSVPTVANGRVYVGTKTSLVVYGLLQ
jgi:hypothetical protein